MKRFMMGVCAVACIGALCVGMVGCGSQGSSSASASAASASASSAASASAAGSAASSAASMQVESGAPAANVNPADINPSQLSGNDNAPDIWHLNGDASAEGFYLSRYDNDAGLSFTRVDASGNDGDVEFNLVITDDKHLRNPLGLAPKVDLVFQDDMNCYDCVTGNSYSRAVK